MSVVGVLGDAEIFHLYILEFKLVSNLTVLSDPKNWALDDL
jgi:hypothetical protein